jgi:serine acetyltransferase
LTAPAYWKFESISLQRRVFKLSVPLAVMRGCSSALRSRLGAGILCICLQSRVSEVFAVDIHPAVPIGNGVFIDHGTGLVVGETAVIGENVSILRHGAPFSNSADRLCRRRRSARLASP